MGSLTKGMTGGGFLYTNRDSISLGIVVAMHQMKSRGDELESWQLLDEFKEVAQIKPLVAGGTVAEYSAHAIPEGGIAQVPPLFGDGYLLVGDAAGLSLNALVTVRGMDFAIASGYYAAKAIAAAKKAGDFSRRRPRQLRGRRCARASCSRTCETARAYPRIIENPRLFTRYPELVYAPPAGRLHRRARSHGRPRQEGPAQRARRAHQAVDVARRLGDEEAVSGHELETRKP